MADKKQGALRICTNKLDDGIKATIWGKQNDMRIECGCTVSLESAVLKIIKEWDEMKKKTTKLPS